MQRVLIASAAIACLASVVSAAPAAAQAQYNAGGYSGTINNPSRVYVTPGYNVPPPAPNRPFFYNPPGYHSGAYYDYRRYGDPTTQDSLMSCSYC